jgi:biotin carboxyl carrier protein
MTYDVTIDGTNYSLELEREGAQWQCKLNGERIDIDAVLTRPDVVSLLIGGKAYEIKRERTAVDMHLWVGSVRYPASVRDPRSLRSRRTGASDQRGPQRLVALMPGKVVRILAPESTHVEAGEGIVVMEAMKMQNEIKSLRKGTVTKIVAAEGTRVNAGDLLAIVE